jgi:type IV pilus assembly protein PilN
MRLPINLASQPFPRRRPILVVTGLLSLVLLASLGLLVYLNIANRWEARDTRERIAALQAELNALQQQRVGHEAVLRDPRYAEALEQTVFINSLITRKSVSWTRLFDDLATVLPYNVRLVRVRPQVTPGNQVFLDMDVASPTGEPVIQMLRRMEASPLFGPTEIHTTLAPTEGEPNYRYRISVSYGQKL